MFDNDITFVCVTCKTERNIELKTGEKDRSRCKVCLSLKNKRKLNKSITLDQAEKEYLEYFRLMKLNLFLCRGCNMEMSQSGNHNKKGVCHPCHLMEKRSYRHQLANQQGREFISRADHQAHVIEWHKSFVLDSHVEAYKMSFVHDWHVTAWRHSNNKFSSYDDLFKHHTDDEVAEHFLSIGKPWNNPRLSQAEQHRYRYDLDIEFRLREITKSRINKKKSKRNTDLKIRAAVIKSNVSDRRFSDLGYTPRELKENLEAKFTDGMTWDLFRNGEIHIDHVLPIGLFNIDDMDEFRLCWGLNNLQPLWASANRSKSDDLPDGRSMRALSSEDRDEARKAYLSH